MKILMQIINKKIELSDELMINRKYNRGIWNFYVAFNISLSILNLHNTFYAKKRNSTWKRLLTSKHLDTDRLEKMKKFMTEDMNIIIEAIKFIEEKHNENPYEGGNIDAPFVIGISSYEMPT